MSKKFSLALLLVFVLSSASFCDTFSQRDELSASISGQAGSILTNNKPVYDENLTPIERYYEDGETGKQKFSPFTTNRICAKDKTIAIGASNGEIFQPCYFVTEDPKIIFAGNIKVGESVKTLEKFIGAPVKDFNDLGDDEKIIWGSSDIDVSEFYTLYISNEKISRVECWIYLDDVPITQRTIDFATRTASKLGITITQSSLEKLEER